MKIISKNVTENNSNTSNITNLNNKSTLNQTKIDKKVKKSIDHTILFRYRYIIGVFELIIKGISRDEIDLFRGQYFYILLDPKIFVGYYYLFILIFLAIRIFFELIFYINTHQNNTFPCSKFKSFQEGIIRYMEKYYFCTLTQIVFNFIFNKK